MASAKELTELTQKITTEELVTFLNDVVRRPDGVSGDAMKCAVCQADEWMLSPYPGDNTRPVVVSHPIPFSQNQALWYFPMNCRNCGHTVFFDALTVTRAISERRES